MDINLEELEKMVKEITPLPWKITDRGWHLNVTDSNPKRQIAKVSNIPMACKENAIYIVASCNAVPKLIERICELERNEAEKIREVVDLKNKVEELEQRVHTFAGYLEKFCHYSEREGSSPIFLFLSGTVYGNVMRGYNQGRLDRVYKRGKEMRVTKEDIEAYSRIMERAKELVLKYVINTELLYIDYVFIDNGHVLMDYAFYDSVQNKTIDKTYAVSVAFFIGDE